MPHVISDTGGRNYVWGDIIQLRITTRLIGDVTDVHTYVNFPQCKDFCTWKNVSYIDSNM